MSPTEYLIAIAICGAGAALYFWSQRLVKKQTEAKRIGRYDEKKAAATSAIVYLIVGVILIIVMLVNWNRVPEENIGLAIGFLAMGAILILYAAYKWYGARRTDQD